MLSAPTRTSDASKMNVPEAQEKQRPAEDDHSSPWKFPPTPPAPTPWEFNVTPAAGAAASSTV